MLIYLHTTSHVNISIDRHANISMHHHANISIHHYANIPIHHQQHHDLSRHTNMTHHSMMVASKQAGERGRRRREGWAAHNVCAYTW